MTASLRHRIEDAIEASYVDLGDGGKLVDTPAATDLILDATRADVETLRRQRDEIAATAELMVAALDGGNQWEIDQAITLTTHLLNQLHRKDEQR